MCGIVGYIGKRQALPVLLQGLKRLEYRGYDSSGVALHTEHEIRVERAVGKIAALEERLREWNGAGTVGIGHTRWATHGAPSERNAHPHKDCTGSIAVVHNGIIENYAQIKRELEGKGHEFQSETDTEVLAHLVEDILGKEAVTEEAFAAAVRGAIARVRGTYGIVVMHSALPGTLVVARMGSPIVLGIGEGEFFIASDASAIIAHTRQMIFLDDGEFATIRANGYEITSLDRRVIEKPVSAIEWSAEAAEKNGHPHFMLKEMLEQPEVLQNSLRGRLNLEQGMAVLGGLRDVSEELRAMDRLVIVGCGSAYYAGLFGEYVIENLAHVPVEVELASEFRYRNPVITERTVVLAISQSGETADTLAAVREAKQKGALTLGLVNVVGSTIARETDAGVYNHAGPEIGVATTKVFLSQCTILSLIALLLARQRNLSGTEGRAFAESLMALPSQVRETLKSHTEIEKIAERFTRAQHAFFLGRRAHTPMAYEGALKLKEIAYVHAEGYAAGEMKHGPIALLEPGFPVVVFAPGDAVIEKVRSNIQEVRARGGEVVAIATDAMELEGLARETIIVPKTDELLQPILSVIPTQLLAYYAAIRRGYDPDKPRNLAKSVTVE